MWLKLFQKFDWVLFACTSVLLIMSVVLIYSTGVANANGQFLALRQLLYIGAGLVLLAIMSIINFNSYRNYAWIAYVLGNAALILVLFFGKPVRGTRSWFSVGSFNLQPSEFMKVILIVLLASYFARFADEIYKIRHIAISGLLALIPILLTLIEPDLGSALIFIAIWIGMAIVAGMKRTYIIALVITGIISSILAWSFLLRPYQKDRIMTFMQPQADPLGQGYNVIQSMIAVGSGGWWGKGLGHGSQSQLNFLPEQHTDFIFAVLAEQLGFAGAFSLLGVFALLFIRMIKNASNAQNNFGFMIIVGAICMLIAQILINIGMNMGIMPVAGIPLPLVSYGGSSMLASLIMIGIVESIAIRRRKLANA